MAMAKTPCGSWNNRNALSMMAAPDTLMSVATTVAMKALKLIIPRLMITGPNRMPTRRTSGLRSASR